MSAIQVEIWSDIACPYCYIGKRKFEKALALFSHADEVEVVWHSYELEPNLSKGMGNGGWHDHLKHITGGTDASVKEKADMLTALAQEVGLEYHLEKVIFTNTSDALRLVKLANERGLADQAEEVLFKAYFVEGKDVSDKNVLIEAGTCIGLRAKDVAELLGSDRFLDEIAQDIVFSENELNLEYIPFYRINGKITIEGSLAIEDYLKALEAACDDNEDPITFSGQSCSIDGACS